MATSDVCVSGSHQKVVPDRHIPLSSNCIAARRNHASHVINVQKGGWSDHTLSSSAAASTSEYVSSNETAHKPEHCAQFLLHHDTNGVSITEPKPFPKYVRALRLAHHGRSRSATTTPHPPQSVPSSSSSRMRAVSTSEHGESSFCEPSVRVFSLSTLRCGIVPKAMAVIPVATEGEETLGSFAPTSCPRRRLQSLLGTSPRPSFLQRTSRRLTISTSSLPRNHRHQDPCGSPSTPDSPIPSICRTPSAYSESEYFPTAPSSAGPLTPIQSATPLPSGRDEACQTQPTTQILAVLEDKSRFRVRTSCSSCNKPGSNYPCCPRCGEMWCSRVCRLKSTGGKKHACSRASM